MALRPPIQWHGNGSAKQDRAEQLSFELAELEHKLLASEALEREGANSGNWQQWQLALLAAKEQASSNYRSQALAPAHLLSCQPAHRPSRVQVSAAWLAELTFCARPGASFCSSQALPSRPLGAKFGQRSAAFQLELEFAAAAASGALKSGRPNSAARRLDRCNK